ncbi:hypothetical protein [uncultured Dokdonia sp.]|uniref:hypothetical protein n=1 Tax=uncultured Dokdonia sp. TaxID=575653 RepID=UPI00261ECC70|nr:hypothetical protein [uncultured Dokdonia sp.]
MKKSILLLNVLLAIFLFSCEKDDFGNSIPESEIINQQDDVSFQIASFGETVTADFTGRIVNVLGDGIPQAQITIGASTSQTDDNGVFIMQDVTTFENIAFFKVRKEGYILGSRALIPAVNTINDVQITLLEKNIVTTVQSGIASVAVLGESNVSFTGDFIDENNNPYTGEVEVSMHYLKPNERTTFEQMPGMLFAQDLSNEARSLETYGMLAVNLFSPSGDILNIAEDTPATIEFPVDNTQIGIAPDTIPLWFFDENVGYWKEQGEAIKVGDKYIGEVTHFTWWNCDLPIRYIEVCITIQDENETLGAVPIQIIRNETGQVIFDGLTNQDGSECGLFPINEEVTLKVFGIDDCAGEQLYETQLGPYSADTLAVITIPEGVINQTTLIGTVTNCDGALLENGLGVLMNDFGQIISIPFTIENGVLDYTFIYCSQTSYDLVIIDQSQNQSTELLPITITSEETNVGTVSTCDQQGGVFEGDVFVSTQEEINAFGALGYTEITGNLVIFGGTSLEPFEDLTTIGGIFQLGGTQLTNLNGLENLTSLPGSIQIEFNNQLISIEALSNVTSVGNIFISYNANLESYNGLENAQIQEGGRLALTANLLIEEASVLSNIIPQHLESLSLVGCSSSFCTPQPLNDLSFLSNLNSVGNLNIQKYQGASLEGLHNIITADNVFLQLDNLFTSLDGLSGLQTVNEVLAISYNPTITDLSGLENIADVNSLWINNNEVLTDFCAVEDLIINGLVEDLVINDNAYNPTVQNFLDGNCSN